MLRELRPQRLHPLHGHVVGGARRGVARLGLVEGALRDEPLGEERLRARVFLLGVLHLRGRPLHLRGLRRILQVFAPLGQAEVGAHLLESGALLLEGQLQLHGSDLYEGLSGPDTVPHVGEHAGDLPLHLGADGDLLVGKQRADRLHHTLDLALFDRHHLRPHRAQGIPFARPALETPGRGQEGRQHERASTYEGHGREREV